MTAVAERLRRRLLEEGPLPFAAFMEEALYGPGGYYAGAVSPVGEAGDFVTGSSLSRLFGRATARLLRALDGPLDAPAELFEAGCGAGSHLAAVHAALDPGDRRRLRGWDRVSRPLPAGVEAVECLDVVERREVAGVVFSYELFDALPVHRLVGAPAGERRELWVGLDAAGALVWLDGPLSDPALAELLAGEPLLPGQVADLAPGWRPLYRALAERLGRGLLVTCDYGYPRPQLLDARSRRHGTLACHRRHQAHRDALRDPGEQDLTAHVDFTALRRCGEEAGLQTVAFVRQARWLTACGIFTDLAGADAELQRQARLLLDGEGMGETIRVLVQARGVDAAALFDPELVAGPFP